MIYVTFLMFFLPDEINVILIAFRRTARKCNRCMYPFAAFIADLVSFLRFAGGMKRDGIGGSRTRACLACGAQEGHLRVDNGDARGCAMAVPAAHRRQAGLVHGWTARSCVFGRCGDRTLEGGLTS